MIFEWSTAHLCFKLPLCQAPFKLLFIKNEVVTWEWRYSLTQGAHINSNHAIISRSVLERYHVEHESTPQQHSLESCWVSQGLEEGVVWLLRMKNSVCFSLRIWCVWKNFKCLSNMILHSSVLSCIAVMLESNTPTTTKIVKHMMHWPCAAAGSEIVSPFKNQFQRRFRLWCANKKVKSDCHDASFLLKFVIDCRYLCWTMLIRWFEWSSKMRSETTRHLTLPCLEKPSP